MAESLRDQLSAAFEQVENNAIEGDGKDVSNDTTIPVPGEGETAAPLERASTIAEAPKADPTGRLHGKDGKFVEKKADAGAEKSGDAAPSSSSQAAPSDTAAVPAPAPARKIPRPSSWKKDFQAHWDKLTAGEQLTPEEANALAQYMNTRETDFQHGVATYKREWESAKPLLEAVQPFQPFIEQMRVDPGTWIRNLGNAHAQLATGSPQQKLQLFARLAQDYGVPVQALVDPQAQQQYLASAAAQQQYSQPAGPPALTREEADRLFQERFAAMQAEQDVARLAADAEKFPHLESVRETMAQLLESGLADDLPSAYEAALRHPRHSDIWDAMQEQRRAQDDEARRRAEAERLARAKGKAVSVRSSTPSGAAEEKPKGLRSQLENAFDEHAGGGRV